MVLELKKELNKTSLWGQSAPSTTDCLRQKCEQARTNMYYALLSNRCSYCPLMQTWCESRRECRKRPRSDNIGRLWPDRVNLTPESSRRPRTFENNGNHCLLLHLISYKSMNICPIFFVANKQLIMEPNWMDRTDLFLRNNAVQQAGELRGKTDDLTWW